MKRTWEAVDNAASDVHCPTKYRMDGPVERQSVVRCLVCQGAGNAFGRRKYAEVLAAPKSLEAVQEAC